MKNPQSCITEGKIVPVAITCRLLVNAMDRHMDRREAEGMDSASSVFLIDGFPRNMDNLNGWIQVQLATNHVLQFGLTASKAWVSARKDVWVLWAS